VKLIPARPSDITNAKVEIVLIDLKSHLIAFVTDLAECYLY